MQQKPPPHPPGAAAPFTPHDDDPTATATASTLFNWSDFLDFNLDEALNVSFSQPEPDPQPPVNPGRVRKRDPRLACSNFLAGRVPCACPELDAQLAAAEEEEGAGPSGKKRARTARGSGLGPARCQVPGCGADISGLKGYHRRHRVCLRCANASEVVVDGESKRYCQQCGKFHILSDFDEGKRSCRRKLERHNIRRRRKPNDSKEGVEKEAQLNILADDVSGDDDAGKEGTCVSSQIEEREILLESDGHSLGSQNLQSDSFVSFATIDETQIEGDKQNQEYKHLQSYRDNKSTFSSVCPSGRISFKLYDWNPAEFPRRLRNQIFQWLASMPIELEGYIRPGCTILTAFISMPKPAWIKLLEEPTSCIKDLVASPTSVLFGRGTMHVYLNDMVFLVRKDSTSVVKVKVKDQAPKLHYIYPTCFEAGRPMEFVACGSYLLQSNFRFLISFAGRYLAYNFCVSSLCSGEGDDNRADHQLLKIYVPQIDIAIFGPAFIEVENQSGLSNFIPILIGDKETCTEMEMLQQKFDTPLSSQEQKWSACEGFSLRQAHFSEFVLDVAWLLKNPASEQKFTPIHIQRFNYLLEFLIEKESFVVLERVFCSLRSAIGNNLVDGVSNYDMRLLRRNMDISERRLARKLNENEISEIRAPDGDFCHRSSENENTIAVRAANQGIQRTLKNISIPDEDATVPLLNREVIMNVNIPETPIKSRSRLLTRTCFTSRPLIIMAIMAVGVCFGICAVIFHPQMIGQIAMTMQRCLFENS